MDPFPKWQEHRKIQVQTTSLEKIVAGTRTIFRVRDYQARSPRHHSCTLAPTTELIWRHTSQRGGGGRSGSTQDGIPVTRASCLECVSKHLGAAYVLLTETREGYAHRLRAIGHLHEAEDESQQMPDLHAAIRAARKSYQTDGTIPNWEALAQAAEAVRQVAL